MAVSAFWPFSLLILDDLLKGSHRFAHRVAIPLLLRFLVAFSGCCVKVWLLAATMHASWLDLIGVAGCPNCQRHFGAVSDGFAGTWTGGDLDIS